MQSCSLAVRQSKRRRGQTLVLLAVALVVLFGLMTVVIGVGRLLAAKGDLGNDADAVALAAALELPYQSKASAKAAEMGSLLGVEQTIVTFPDSNTMQVLCSRTYSHVGYSWGLGFGLETITSYSKITLSRPVGISNGIPLRPIAIAETSYRTGLVTLNLVQRAPGTNQFAALQLGGSGATNYINNLENGYFGSVSVADVLSVETTPMNAANLIGIVNDPVTGRALFQQALQPPYNDDGNSYTYPNYPYGDPRIIIAVMVRAPGGGGGGGGRPATSVQVRGFAAFYIKDVTGGGSKISGRFLDYAVHQGVVDGRAADFGLVKYALSL